MYSNKGNYPECSKCKFFLAVTYDINSKNFPCYYSHTEVKQNVINSKCTLFTERKNNG